MANWIQIRAEYESTSISYRKVADKYGVSFNTLKDKAKREGWAKSKKETQQKITTKTLQKVVVKEAGRNARILSIADRLADKIESAVEQLEQYIVTNKTKTKTIEYSGAVPKPVKEVVVEEEIKNIVPGIVDKQGLKFLTAALKDLRDIQPKEETPDNPNIKPYVDALKASMSEVWGDE